MRERWGRLRQWFAERPWWVKASLLVAGASALVAWILDQVEAPRWIQVLNLLLGSAVLIASIIGAELARQATVHEEQAAREAKEAQKRANWERKVSATVSWPLKRLSELDPIADLGVRESELADDHRGEERLAPYVRRDADRDADEKFRASWRLLLIGEASSGATRTAYEEIAREATDDRFVLIPHARANLWKALDELDVLAELSNHERVILWLDRIDLLDQRRLAEAIRKFQARTPGNQVVATVPHGRYKRWSTEHREADDLFKTIRLPRRPTAAERERAAEMYPGVDFQHGIAAAFTSAAALVRRLRDGYDQCPDEPAEDCPVARTLVQAALEWHATDTTVPPSVPELVNVLRADPELLDEPTDDHILAALDWAAAPVHEGSSLLQLDPVVDGVAYDGAVWPHPDTIGLDPAPVEPQKAVWRVAIQAAHESDVPGLAGRIAFTAHTMGKYKIAERFVWSRLTSLDQPEVEWLQRAYDFSDAAHNTRGEVSAAKQLLRLTEAKYGTDDVEVTAALTNLGLARQALGEYTEAKKLHQRALTIVEKAHGPDHVQVAIALGNLSNTHSALGEYEKARDLQQRVLTIEESAYGPDHIQIAATLTNLGNAHRGLGEHKEARVVLQRALSVSESVCGPNHPWVAATLTSLGATHNQLGDYPEAQHVLQRALSIKIREYGKDHAEIAVTLVNLGGAHLGLADYPEAQHVLQRALSIFEGEHGPDHSQVAKALTNLAGAHHGLRNYTSAQGLLRRALTIEACEYGNDHPEVATTLYHLGEAHRELGEYAEANDLFKRALAIFRREYGSGHPHVATILYSLGLTWMGASRSIPEDGAKSTPESANARACLIRALQVVLANPDSGGPDPAELRRLLKSLAPEIVVLDDGTVVQRTADAQDADQPTT